MKWQYEEAMLIASRVKDELEPHCYRCEIAGSLRRRKPEVKDIDIVCIPRPFDFGLFESGFAEVVNQWKMLNGKVTHESKQLRRVLPEGINLDIFIAAPDNYGYLLAMKTGSVGFNVSKFVKGWKQNGYDSEDGYLYRDRILVPVREELEMFHRCGVEYVEPWHR